VVTAYLDDLADWLEKRFHKEHPNDCLTAAQDAILVFIKNPMSYDPDKKSLKNYFRMSAAGDMPNLLEKERRHSDRRVHTELSEPIIEKHLQDEEADPPRVLQRRAEKAEVEARVRSLIPDWLAVGSTPEEIQVVGLMRIGEHRTRVYAAALGLAHLPFRDQQEEVKRVKDRLKKRERKGASNDR